MKRVAQVLADRDEQPPLIRYLPAFASYMMFIPIALMHGSADARYEERAVLFGPIYRDGILVATALAIWAVLRLRGRVRGWTGSGLCLAQYAYITRLFHDFTLGFPVPRGAVMAEQVAPWRASAAFAHPATTITMWIGFALCAHACVSDWRTLPRRQPRPSPKIFD